MLNRMGMKMWVLLAVLVASLAADTQTHADEFQDLGDRISGKLIRGIRNVFRSHSITGVVETATFLVPLPTYKPLLTPVYAWESVDPSDVMAAGSK